LVGIGFNTGTSVCSHYVLARPAMGQLMPVAKNLQKNVRQHLINKKVLKKAGLGHKNGYNYEDANFAQLAPHISLLPIPTTKHPQQTIPQLKKLWRQYPANKKPTAFSFKGIEAFLPNPKSNVIFIVARTSSNVPFGFKDLSQYFERKLRVTNPQPWFLGHITLGTIRCKPGRSFTQKHVNALNKELQKFRHMPKGSYRIQDIVFSQFKGPMTAL
jgi:2'-5' RNA ligase